MIYGCSRRKFLCALGLNREGCGKNGAMSRTWWLKLQIRCEKRNSEWRSSGWVTTSKVSKTDFFLHPPKLVKREEWLEASISSTPSLHSVSCFGPIVYISRLYRQTLTALQKKPDKLIYLFSSGNKSKNGTDFNTGKTDWLDNNWAIFWTWTSLWLYLCCFFPEHDSAGWREGVSFFLVIFLDDF